MHRRDRSEVGEVLGVADAPAEADALGEALDGALALAVALGDADVVSLGLEDVGEPVCSAIPVPAPPPAEQPARTSVRAAAEPASASRRRWGAVLMSTSLLGGA